MFSRSSMQRLKFPKQQPKPRALTLAEAESVSGGTWASGPGAPQPPPGGDPADPNPVPHDKAKD